jgi:FixJ family two-component response regulator
MSGITEGEMLAVAKTLGAVAVLKKPFDHEQLLIAVEKACDARFWFTGRQAPFGET